MPSRRLSKGRVPQHKQALDPEAGWLSLSGGPLEWGVIRQPRRSHNRQCARNSSPRAASRLAFVGRSRPDHRI